MLRPDDDRSTGSEDLWWLALAVASVAVVVIAILFLGLKPLKGLREWGHDPLASLVQSVIEDVPSIRLHPR